MRFSSCYDRSFWKRPSYFHTFPTIFRGLPNFSKKCVKLFWQLLSNSEVILSVKGKLNCIFVINHVLKNNLSGFVCQVREIDLVVEWNQGLEISPQAVVRHTVIIIKINLNHGFPSCHPPCCSLLSVFYPSL